MTEENDEVLKRLPAWYVELRNAYLKQAREGKKEGQKFALGSVSFAEPQKLLSENE